MQAVDVMTFGAASIRADAPVEEAARVMLQHRISGLPVVDDNGDLVGMVTEGDLLRREASAQRRSVAGARARLCETRGWAATGAPCNRIGSHDSSRGDGERGRAGPGGCGYPAAPSHQTGAGGQGRKVTGIVSRADLLRGLARLAEDMPAASAEDRALRQRVLDALAQVPKDGWRSVNVVVRNGTVELRGATADANLRERLVTAVRGAPGVKRAGRSHGCGRAGFGSNLAAINGARPGPPPPPVLHPAGHALS